MIKEYTCSTCNKVFSMEPNHARNGHKVNSNQAKCPICGNIQPTWPKVKVGNGHIHPGRK